MAVDKWLKKLGAPVAELQAAALERLVDAESLRQTGRYASAISHGVYSVEILLKVLICKHLDLANLPTVFETHDLEALLLYTGLSGTFVGSKSDMNVAKNWEQVVLVSRQVEGSRYKHDPAWNEIVANEFFLQLRDGQYGVVSCLIREFSKKTR